MLDDILNLDDHALDRLIDALKRGAIGDDPTELQLGRVGLAGDHASIRRWFAEARAAFGPGGIAAALELLRGQRRRLLIQAPELVLTAPHLPGLAVRETRVVARELFESARRSVLIFGFAFHGADLIFAPLAERMVQVPALEVAIVVNVHREPGLSPEHILAAYARRFREQIWPFAPIPAVSYAPGSLGPGLQQVKLIHLKTIVVDRSRVFLGSANFTGAGFDRNLEAGIRIDSAQMAGDLHELHRQLLETGELVELKIR